MYDSFSAGTVYYGRALLVLAAAIGMAAMLQLL